MSNNTIVLTPALFAQGSFQEVAVSALLTNRLQLCINRYEIPYLMKLISNQVSTAYPIGLAQLFINECNANFTNNNAYGPTSARMIKIFNTLDFQIGRKTHHSNGIQDLLMCAIFYHYITDKEFSDSQNGIVSGTVDAEKKAYPRVAWRFAESRYNNMLESWETIQWFMRSGDGIQSAGHGGNIDYPEYIQPVRPKAAGQSLWG